MIFGGLTLDYLISCCSPADLPMEHWAKRNVSVKYYKYMLGNQTYEDDGGKSIALKDFYQAMRDGAATKTSQVNIEEFKEYFSKLIKENDKDILHISLSSGISGTYNCARLAAKEVMELFPNRKVYVVDSLGASGGYGLLVDWVCDLKESGMDIESLYNYAEENKKRIHHWFYSTDLTFYVRGGRISKASGFIGNLLKICPVMNVNFEGKLIPRIKTLGRKKALRTTIDLMRENADDGVDYSGKCIITHSDCYDEAMQLKSAIEETFPHLAGKVMVSDIGTTIGCHSGPGTVATFFIGKERVD